MFKKLLLPLILLHCIFNYVETQARNVSISRDHVSVWFESPLHKSVEHEKENLEGMIKLVSGTFGTIIAQLAPQTPLLKTQTLITELVAEHNRKKGTKKLKVIISFEGQSSGFGLFYQVHSNVTVLRNLENAKQAADKANAIYPGTVETLLLHNPIFLPIKTLRLMSDYNYQLLQFALSTMDHLKPAAEFLRDSFQSSSQLTYKLGLTVPYVTCLNSIVQTPNFTEILQNVDIVVPSIYYHKHEGLTAFEEHDMIKNTHEQCEKNIQQVKNLEIIPLVSCKPTVSGDHSDVSEFLDCWEQMSDWATENEKQVIMYEAFDRVDRFHVHHKGWWRLRHENASWVDASSFVATPDDKFQISLNTETTFDRWIAVFFDHRVRYYPHFISYSKEELQQMLGLVSTRFSTIVTGIKPYINSSSSSENITWTATMVARLNRENEFNPSFQPLEVIHTVYPEMANLRDWLLYDTDLRQDVSLEKPLKVAQEANAIFPGTVTTIVFHKADSGFGWNGFKKALKTQFGNTNNSNAIRFGTYVDLSKCEVLKADFKAVSEWLKVIIVELASDFRSPIPWLQIGNQKTAAYMDSALRNLFGKWEECRDSFHAVYPEVEVTLAVDCSKVMRTHENTTKEQLAKCWEMVTDYAEENNICVVLYQAFDTPYPLKAPLGDRYVHDYTKGWWKLHQKSEVNITADSFEEQFKDLVSDSMSSNKSIYRTARLGSKCEACGRKNVSMIVAIVILSVLCFGLIMAVVHLYKGNIFRKLGQRDHVKFQVLSEDVTF